MENIKFGDETIVIKELFDLIDSIIDKPEEPFEVKSGKVLKSIRNLIIGYSSMPFLIVSGFVTGRGVLDPRISSSNPEFYYNTTLAVLLALLSICIMVLNNQMFLDDKKNLKKYVIAALQNDIISYDLIETDEHTKKFVNNYFKLLKFLKLKYWNNDLEQ